MLWVTLAKDCKLPELKMRAFSAVLPTLFNTILLEIRVALALLVVQKFGFLPSRGPDV